MKERTIMTQIASFGSWKSPITSDLIVSETIKFGQVVLDGSDIYWMEVGKARCLFREATSTHHHVPVLMVLAWLGSPGIIRICLGIALNCGLGRLERMAQSYSRSA